MISITIFLLLGLLAMSISVAVSLGLLAGILAKLYTAVPLERMIGEMAWQSLSSESLVAIPFFILLGEILLRSGIAERMYAALVQWLSWLPGGTMHANIGACSLFAASSGSSVATAATIGTVSLPEIEKRGYNERLFLGTLAAGGTLGILIPPSVALIIYGVLTETSIPRLYLAGMIPGVVLALLEGMAVQVRRGGKEEVHRLRPLRRPVLNRRDSTLSADGDRHVGPPALGHKRLSGMDFLHRRSSVDIISTYILEI